MCPRGSLLRSERLDVGVWSESRVREGRREGRCELFSPSAADRGSGIDQSAYAVKRRSKRGLKRVAKCITSGSRSWQESTSPLSTTSVWVRKARRLAAFCVFSSSSHWRMPCIQFGSSFSVTVRGGRGGHTFSKGLGIFSASRTTGNVRLTSAPLTLRPGETGLLTSEVLAAYDRGGEAGSSIASASSSTASTRSSRARRRTSQ
mmetsp:Transcript_17939/g.38215  ORF Transcript_17939/g.38215 Transcript_17939/m.38215 type:complete len:204 (+) Transcript_17939:2638-3249(+)